tara:strand:- start:182 stop:493 length:312 start_codon:yes stop_codon:yes gene_type:complete
MLGKGGSRLTAYIYKGIKQMNCTSNLSRPCRGVTYLGNVPCHVSDTHLALAENLRENLHDWMKKIHPNSSLATRRIYAEEIADAAFNPLHDLAMDLQTEGEED